MSKHCARMQADVPEDYCGRHATHCQGCPELPSGRAVAAYDYRGWFMAPTTRNGFEYAERYTSISGHAEFRARRGGCC